MTTFYELNINVYKKLLNKTGRHILTQAELAEKNGVSPVSLTKAEKGRPVGRNVALKMARSFDVGINDLFKVVE